jgi:hypothetical protein
LASGSYKHAAASQYICELWVCFFNFFYL